MSGHYQPPSTTSAQPAAANDQALMALQRDFPRHRIWREILPGRTRYVARRTRPGPGPHTLVTPDLAELHTAPRSRPPGFGHL
jgi:hypothetical protein